MTDSHESVQKGKKKNRGRSGIRLDSTDLATFGCTWREGVPAIIETNIYRTN
jgi:hypothetical protein